MTKYKNSKYKLEKIHNEVNKQKNQIRETKKTQDLIQKQQEYVLPQNYATANSYKIDSGWLPCSRDVYEHNDSFDAGYVRYHVIIPNIPFGWLPFVTYNVLIDGDDQIDDETAGIWCMKQMNIVIDSADMTGLTNDSLVRVHFFLNYQNTDLSNDFYVKFLLLVNNPAKII